MALRAFSISQTFIAMGYLKGRRRENGELYGFKCKECESIWKVYQNEYHKENCSHHGSNQTKKDKIEDFLTPID